MTWSKLRFINMFVVCGYKHFERFQDVDQGQVRASKVKWNAKPSLML